MNFPLMRVVLWIFLATIVRAPAVTADDFVVPAITAPRISHMPESLGDCFAPAAPASGYDDQISAKLTIAADGALKEFSLRDGSPDWMKGLTDCALSKLQFTPGTQDGVAVESQAFLALKFAEYGAEKAAAVGIVKLGPLMTAPRLVRMPEGTDDCYPPGIARRGSVARFVVSLNILPDGEVTNVTLPVGGEPWYEKTARCVLERVAFIPGTRDGIPVEAQASLPIVYKTVSGEVSASELRSKDEELEAAYRACYPSDLATIASAFYSFEIATNGRVRNPKVIKGSGNPRLDEAGACIMKRLEFTPLMQNGRALRSTVTWELPIRPPRTR